MTEVEERELARLRAAEEVCWTLILQMGLGILKVKDPSAREFLATPMLAWADLAAEAGLIRRDEPEDTPEPH
jgi:hypothetical protein